MKTEQKEKYTLIDDADWVRRMAELENYESISVGGFLRFLPPEEARKFIENSQKKVQAASTRVTKQ